MGLTDYYALECALREMPEQWRGFLLLPTARREARDNRRHRLVMGTERTCKPSVLTSASGGRVRWTPAPMEV